MTTIEVVADQAAVWLACKTTPAFFRDIVWMLDPDFEGLFFTVSRVTYLQLNGVCICYIPGSLVGTTAPVEDSRPSRTESHLKFYYSPFQYRLRLATRLRKA